MLKFQVLNTILLVVCFTLQILTFASLGYYVIWNERHIHELEDAIYTGPAVDESDIIELTIYDIQINAETMEIYQTRTATRYPLENVIWEAMITDEFTQEILCSGSGTSTIEERENNTVVLSIPVWAGDPDCVIEPGTTIAAVGRWYWSDHLGRARVSTFRSDPVTISQ